MFTQCLYSLSCMSCWRNLNDSLYCVQLLIRSGRNPDETLMILVPEAYKNHPTLLAKYPEVIVSRLCLLFKLLINSATGSNVVTLH